MGDLPARGRSAPELRRDVGPRGELVDDRHGVIRPGRTFRERTRDGHNGTAKAQRGGQIVPIGWGDVLGEVLAKPGGEVLGRMEAFPGGMTVAEVAGVAEVQAQSAGIEVPAHPVRTDEPLTLAHDTSITSVMVKPVGLTRDAGWQLGVSRTIAVSREDVWDFLLGDGLSVWLGETTLGETPGDPYETADGTRGELRGFRPNDRIRLTWQPADADHDSTVQIALRQAKTGTTIVFHHERLRSAAERERLLTHWREVADRVRAFL